jgi:hypothetical protein
MALPVLAHRLYHDMGRVRRCSGCVGTMTVDAAIFVEATQRVIGILEDDTSGERARIGRALAVLRVALHTVDAE